MSTKFTPDERWKLLAIAEAATPAGDVLRLPDGETIATVETIVSHFGGALVGSAYRALLSALDLASIPLEGQRLTELPLARRQHALERLNSGEATYWMVRAVVAPIKLARARAPSVEALVKNGKANGLPVVTEQPRWLERITDARSLEHDEQLDVDVVIVGSGAGGAPLARSLASRGHAVVILEEGGHFTRKDFTGDPLAMQGLLYRDHGVTLALGNAFIPVPVGKTVGGTTTINSGTCYRTPAETLHRWQLEHGLHELGPGALNPYFERVERVLEVAPSTKSVLGGCAEVIARGCDALGYAHAPLARNAPGCDAQALCCFGCPTDAKRSTNVSYIPLALESGAMLFHHTRVENVLTENGRAVGVEAVAVPVNGVRRRLVVRAKAVVLACGAFHTPALLLANGLANSSDQVGRNLTIHPCGYSWAQFDHPIRGWEEVPQGYSVEEFVDQGIRFEGGFVPLQLAAGAFTQVGPRWTEMIERFENLACFGFMISDQSRGRVTLGVRGDPSIAYRVNDADLRTLAHAQALLARIYFAAGARTVYPGVQLFDELRSLADVERFEREGPTSLRAHHHDLSAFHPLGTCHMGRDASRSVIGPSHETHDVPGLFVVDGSAVPGPLGVNPQVTIMALSERATEFVERRVEDRAPLAKRPIERARMGFEETMAGALTLAGRETSTSFTVRARAGVGLAKSWLERGSTFALDGTISIAGVADRVACQGSLRMRPLRRRASLVYDLSFLVGDARYTLHGEKHAPLFVPTGMTKLYTELRRDGEQIAQGLLLFDLRDLPPWLASFRVERLAG